MDEAITIALWLIGALCLLGTLLGAMFNGRFIRRKCGTPARRWLRFVISVVCLTVTGTYLFLLAQGMPMPSGGIVLSIGLLALILVNAAGAIANEPC